MKNFYILISIVFVGLSTTQAQQLPQFTQYMYNTIAINPAYAGSRDAFTLVGLHRSQWAGITGGPETQTLSVHSPLPNEQIGLGLSLINDKAGYENFTYINADFSYTINVNEETTLAFGLKAGANYYSLDSELLTDPSVADDPFFRERLNRWTPNVGAGLFLSAQKWYVGLSSPKVFRNDNNELDAFRALEEVHFYLTGGYVFDLSAFWKLRPTVLAKTTSGAPLSFDFSSTVIYDEKLYLGAAYRYDDAIGAFVNFQVFDQFRLGYAYEYTTSELRDFSSGSHEVILIYELRHRNTKYKSPRFF